MPRRLRLYKHTTAALLLAGALSVCGQTAVAKDEIAVIIARDAPDSTLDTATLRNIYLKKVFVDARGHEVIPINLPPGHVLRRAFSAVVLNRSVQALQDYWNQRYFHGIAPPFVLDSPQAVIHFTASTPGAIGYVPACDIDPRVKPVLFISAPAEDRDAIEKLCPGHEHAITD